MNVEKLQKAFDETCYYLSDVPVANLADMANNLQVSEFETMRYLIDSFDQCKLIFENGIVYRKHEEEK